MGNVIDRHFQANWTPLFFDHTVPFCVNFFLWGQISYKTALSYSHYHIYDDRNYFDVITSTMKSYHRNKSLGTRTIL